jgi:hypothetical protein
MRPSFKNAVSGKSELNRQHILAGACVLLAFTSAIATCLAILETDWFRTLEASFYAMPLLDDIPRIQPFAFRGRMVALGVDGLIMAAVTWLLFGARKTKPDAIVKRNENVASLLLFGLCGLALMSYVWSCFLALPLWAHACILHAKEGAIDTMHPILFSISGAMLGLAAVVNLRQAESNRLISLILVAIAATLIVIALEEISCGQTFFKWQTPESVASWNYQNETNLHNAFNFVLGRIYLAAGIIGFLAVAASIFLRRKFPGSSLTAILPTTPMYWGAIWLPPASQGGVYTDTEPFESIVAILAMYYAFHIWRNRLFA